MDDLVAVGNDEQNAARRERARNAEDAHTGTNREILRQRQRIAD